MEIKINKDSKQLVSFLKGCQDIISNDFKRDFPSLQAPAISINNGRRYFKVIRGDETQSSAHCFIDRTNGDVLKAASWKAPAKHARGNILDDDNGLGCMGTYGAAYLKR